MHLYLGPQTEEDMLCLFMLNLYYYMNVFIIICQILRFDCCFFSSWLCKTLPQSIEKT